MLSLRELLTLAGSQPSTGAAGAEGEYTTGKRSMARAAIKDQDPRVKAGMSIEHISPFVPVMDSNYYYMPVASLTSEYGKAACL